MKKVEEFKKWARRESYRRGFICHFYITGSEKQYYNKTDFAFFNLLSKSKDWIVKGTTGHGIKGKKGKPSRVPCLNCFEIDKEFYKAIKTLYTERNEKFDFGVIFNKRRLRNNNFEVIDVSTEMPNPLPPRNKCHRYDNPRFRYGVLKPFNLCNVVRVEIPSSDLRTLPISAISSKAIMGILVKKSDFNIVKVLLKLKGMNQVRVFALL